MPSALDHAKALIQSRRDGTPAPPDAIAWAAGSLELIIYQGADPLPALGLTGHTSPARLDHKAQRDALLRDVRDRWYAGLSDCQAAADIRSALARQVRARGRVTDDLSRALEALLTGAAPVPGSRHLRRILATN